MLSYLKVNTFLITVLPEDLNPFSS